MAYAATAWERAMDVQAVILNALSGDIHWPRAAEILGMRAHGPSRSQLSDVSSLSSQCRPTRV